MPRIAFRRKVSLLNALGATNAIERLRSCSTDASNEAEAFGSIRKSETSSGMRHCCSVSVRPEQSLILAHPHVSVPKMPFVYFYLEIICCDDVACPSAPSHRADKVTVDRSTDQPTDEPTDRPTNRPTQTMCSTLDCTYQRREHKQKLILKLSFGIIALFIVCSR